METKAMAEILLDGLEIETIEDIHTLFIQALALPDYYGRNLDALFDCLTELGRDTVIRLQNQAALEGRLGRRGRALAALLRRAAEENPHITLTEESG